jgi:hypothetical protein
MDPEQILALAEQALADGVPLDEVVELVRGKAEREGMRVGPEGQGDLGRAFRLRVEARDLGEKAETINRVLDRGSVVNAAGMAAQGITAGLLPDFLNMIGQEGASEGFRNFVEETREVQPLAAGLAEGAGAIALPGVGSVRGAQATSRGLSALGGRVGGSVGGLLAAPATTAAVVGGAAGSAAGGLLGFTESVNEDPGVSRLEATIEGATDPLMVGTGALVGPALGFIGSRTRRLFAAKKRGQRVAAKLEESTGLTRDVNAVRDRADLNVETAKTGLDALERETPEILSPDLEEFLDRVRRQDDVVGHLNRASQEVAGGQRFARVSDMRKLQTNLRKDQRFGLASELDAIMDDAVPGYRGANREFASAMDVREAIEIGQNRGGTTFRGDRIQLDTGANFDKALEVLPPEAHDALKVGVLHRELQDILGRRTGSRLEVLRRLADDSGADMRLRRMFNSPDVAEEFIQGLDKEISAEQLRSVLIKGGVLVAIGAGAKAALGSSAADFLGSN